MLNSVWEVKHRPTKLKDYVFQNDKHAEIFTNWVKNQEIPNLLLTGVRGTGKTTLAYILKEELDVDDIDFLKLNASDENSIEDIRKKVKSFISSMAVSKFKIVFLDEADDLSPQAQRALKSMIEDYSDNARFIFTCNEPHRLIPELKSSRLKTFNFQSMDKEKALVFIASILEKENVEVDSIEHLEEYIDMAYPDLRKAVSLVEQYTIQGKLLPPNEVDADESYEKVISLIEYVMSDSVIQNREYIYQNVQDDECIKMYQMLSDYVPELYEGNVDNQKKAIVIISDHMYRDTFVALKQNTLEACLIKLSNLK